MSRRAILDRKDREKNPSTRKTTEDVEMVDVSVRAYSFRLLAKLLNLQ